MLTLIVRAFFWVPFEAEHLKCPQQLQPKDVLKLIKSSLPFVFVSSRKPRYLGAALALQDEAAGGTDKAVGGAELVDQIAPVGNPHTARVTHEEEKGGGRIDGLNGIVKPDKVLAVLSASVVATPPDRDSREVRPGQRSRHPR